MSDEMFLKSSLKSMKTLDITFHDSSDSSDDSIVQPLPSNLPSKININMDSSQWLQLSKFRSIMQSPQYEVFNGIYCNKLINLKVYNKFSVKEFTNECKVLAKLNHSNVATVYQLGRFYMDIPYIFLDLDNMIPLHKYIHSSDKQRDNILMDTSMTKIIKQVINVIHYLHNEANDTHTFIHRNINSKSIALTMDGTIKLIDFGLCTMVPRNNVYEITHNLEGGLGNIRYMAPEMALNLPYNEKVDIYSLGILLYEIITKTLPYEGYLPEDFYTDIIYHGHRPSLTHPLLTNNNISIAASTAVSSTAASNATSFNGMLYHDIITQCWKHHYTERPYIEDILTYIEVNDDYQSLPFPMHKNDSKTNRLLETIFNNFTLSK